jgi:hypothetical protein
LGSVASNLGFWAALGWGASSCRTTDTRTRSTLMFLSVCSGAATDAGDE